MWDLPGPGHEPVFLAFRGGFLTTVPSGKPYFSWMIAVSRTSNTMLNRNGKSGHPCLVPVFRGKAFSFSPLSMMLAVFVINHLYYVQICSLYSKFDESFCNEWMLNFAKCFFNIYWDDHVIFVLLFTTVVYHIDWFVDIEPSLYPWNKFNLIMVYDAFYILLNSVC